jgi:hypothetical protein
MIDLEAIREQDALMGPGELQGPWAHRRALLAYVDALRGQLADKTAEAANALCLLADEQDSHTETKAQLSALREAAGEVECYWCRGSGNFLGTGRDCDRCADLRALLNPEPPTP